MITPPVGINLFVGCKISKIQLESTLKFALQLLVYMLVVLALTTYIPAISLFPSADAYIIKCDTPDVGGELAV